MAMSIRNPFAEVKREKEARFAALQAGAMREAPSAPDHETSEHILREQARAPVETELRAHFKTIGGSSDESAMRRQGCRAGLALRDRQRQRRQ